MNSNSNRIWFEIYLNKSKENRKFHYSIGPHCSPQPRWPTGPHPSCTAHIGSPCQSEHAQGVSKAGIARGHRVVHDQRTPHGELADASSKLYRRQGSRPNLHHSTSYMPLYWNVNRDGQKGVLIEAAGGSVAAVGFDVDKRLWSGRRPLGSAT
jgi:hypothetical protein